LTEHETQWDFVGLRVREARVDAGLTVRELARRIGVSASHVSQVERGIGAFSVPALYAVARELDVSMHALLDPPAKDAAGPTGGALVGGDLERSGIVQRAGEHPSIMLGSGPRWSRLTAGGEENAEFLEVVYAPHTARPEVDIRHEGREYGIVIAGELTVEVDGATASLRPGDSIVFDSTRPHRFWNDSDAEVRAIWFVRDTLPGEAAPHA